MKPCEAGGGHEAARPRHGALISATPVGWAWGAGIHAGMARWRSFRGARVGGRIGFSGFPGRLAKTRQRSGCLSLGFRVTFDRSHSPTQIKVTYRVTTTITDEPSGAR